MPLYRIENANAKFRIDSTAMILKYTTPSVIDRLEVGALRL